MCQAFEGEQRYLIEEELRAIREKLRKHQSGEQRLSLEEIDELAIDKMMLEEC